MVTSPGPFDRIGSAGVRAGKQIKLKQARRNSAGMRMCRLLSANRGYRKGESELIKITLKAASYPAPADRYKPNCPADPSRPILVHRRCFPSRVHVEITRFASNPRGI